MDVKEHEINAHIILMSNSQNPQKLSGRNGIELTKPTCMHGKESLIYTKDQGLDWKVKLHICKNISHVHNFRIQGNLVIRMIDLKNPMHNELGPMRFRTPVRLKYTFRLLGTLVYEKKINDLKKVQIHRLRKD